MYRVEENGLANRANHSLRDRGDGYLELDSYIIDVESFMLVPKQFSNSEVVEL